MRGSLCIGGASCRATSNASPANKRIEVPNDIGDGNLRVVSGNVGVQTATPEHALDVAGDARVRGVLIADSPRAAAAQGLRSVPRSWGH